MRIHRLAWMTTVAGVAIAGAVLSGARGAAASEVIAPPDTNAITPAMVDAGRALFHGKGTCFACHGMSLEGGPIAPTLKAHSWKDAKDGDLSAIYYIDTHGVRGTVMTAHPGGISDADAVNVAAYVWSVGHRGATP
jgi:mono/diheme cytochrome c family protein